MAILAGAAGAAGQLDAGFVNGVAPSGGGIRNPILVVARDGRIVLAGTQLYGSIQTFYAARVAVFDDAGVVIPAFEASDLGEPNAKSFEAATFDAAGRALVGGTVNSQAASGAWLQRVRSDAVPSSTFYPLAPADDTAAKAMQSLFAIAVDAQGRIAAGGSTSVEGTGISPAGQGSPRAVVTLRDRDGKPDLAFGVLGEVLLGLFDAGRVRALGFDHAGIVVVYGAVLQRLDARGAIDSTFGNEGSTSIDGWVSVVFDRLGRALVLAGPDDGRTLTRYVDGRPDPAFARGVAVSLQAPYRVLAAGPDGATYAGRVASANGVATVRVLRVRADGVVEATYGTDGEAIVSFDYGAVGLSGDLALAVDDADRLLVAQARYVRDCLGYFCQTGTVAMLYRFTGPTSPPTTALAVEFFHAGMDHYFTTADTDETAALDTGKFEGWTRTGESFTVAARSAGDAAPVCRFFSGSSFAPKSSHFYTPYPGECDIVDASPEWIFEKIAYLLRIPDNIGDGNGTCPAGLRPLYRAFNRMQGGAPNHRYTTSATTLEAMLARGWVMEGEANTRVFACVPA